MLHRLPNLKNTEKKRHILLHFIKFFSDETFPEIDYCIDFKFKVKPRFQSFSIIYYYDNKI